MKQYIRYIIVWAINTGLILAANTYFPLNYVLGNAVIPPVYAAIFAGFLLTVFDKAMKPVIEKLVKREQNRYVMFGIYWLVNALGIWIIARLSFLSGFGISAYYFALILGLAASLGQWIGRQLFKAVRFS
jgi:uncharacterized membrane protein YvlD (DUF360 family)